jgi:hypothetical protein
MVRRATFLRAGILDKTAYVFESAEKQQLQALISKRRGDIEAVKYAIDAEVAPNAIDARTWPPATTSTGPRPSSSEAATS